MANDRHGDSHDETSSANFALASIALANALSMALRD